MEIGIKGNAKEIASLVLQLQGKQEPMMLLKSRPDTVEDRKALVDVIEKCLNEQRQVHSLRRQLDPTSPEPKRDKESLQE